MYADVELRTAIFRRAFDKVHVAEDMGHTVSSNPARPDPEPGDPRWFAARDAVPLPTEHLIIAVLVAYHNPDEAELEGWCRDVLLQERRWSEVSCATLLQFDASMLTC